jgi:hypothetical protein
MLFFLFTGFKDVCHAKKKLPEYCHFQPVSQGQAFRLSLASYQKQLLLFKENILAIFGSNSADILPK